VADDERDNPGFLVPPPLTYLLTLILGLVLDRRSHVPFLPTPAVGIVRDPARPDRARGALPGAHLRRGIPSLQGEGATLGVTVRQAYAGFREHSFYALG
jgi:hypothetical protein